MNLYRHYKNKFYKLVGFAKHSETREELVIYETRYESPGGKVWLRPKDMFFENIDVDGQLTPRFGKVDLKLEHFTTLSVRERKIILHLADKILGNVTEEQIDKRLSNCAGLHFLLGSIDENPVAFKLGYALNHDTFYSWLGGVLPEFRSLGIAQDLMETQHQWAKAQGYKAVQTKCLSHLNQMQMLNLRCGFQVVGTEKSERGLKVIFNKEI